MRRSIFHRLATMTVMVALVCAGLAVTSPAAEAVTQLNYIVKYTGTDAGYPIQRYGWVVIVVGLPPIPGLQGSNQVDLCFYSGNAYAIEPGSIQVETRTNVCPFDQTLANPPVQLATVQVTSASATTFQVSTIWHSVGFPGGFNGFGGLNCSTLPFGGNPDFFVGAVPGEFVQSVTTVCDGFSKLNLSFANNRHYRK